MNQSISDSATGLPGRYALSLFEIAQEEKNTKFIEEIDNQLLSIASLIESNNDFKSVIKSPIFSADEQLSLMDDILETMKVEKIIKNFIGVLCENRRLFLLPEIIRAFHSFLLNLNKQATAKVTSAKPMSDEQKKNIKLMLSDHFSLDVDVEVIVNEEILGGLVVQMGSKMIDTSLLTRLKSIKNVMNEV